MAITSLNGEQRTGVGKGIAKKLRASGRIPAVYYGRGETPISLVVNAKDVDTLLQGASGANVIVDLQVSGAAAADRKALIREIQRDPVQGNILHLDLQHISLTERITGVKDGGGILEHLLREVEVECLPTDIPTQLEVDVSAMNIGDTLHVSDIKAERVVIVTEADRGIATVVPPTVLEEAKPAEEAPAEPELVASKKEGEEAAEGGKEG